MTIAPTVRATGSEQNRSEMTHLKRPAALVVLALVAVVIVAIVMMRSTSDESQAAVPDGFPDQTNFEAQAWSESDGFPAIETARGEMVGDLMTGGHLDDQSMAGVQQLLGEPQREYEVDGATRWAYWLGRYGFDGSYLEIEFQDGVVSTTGLTEFG